MKSLNYIRLDGSEATAKRADSIFFDEIDGVHRSTEDRVIPIKAWYRYDYITTHSKRDFRNIRISRNVSHYTLDPVHFKQHSGVGMGLNTVKKFKKPRGEAFGIELEMVFDCGDSIAGVKNKLLFSKFIAENFPEWITERDGSLEDNCQLVGRNELVDCNLELVSPPLSVRDLESCLEVIIPTALKLGACCIGDWYGLHITANLATKNISTPERFIRIVNENKKIWEEASGRKGSIHLNKYAKFFKLKDYGDVAGVFHSGGHYFSTYPRNASGSAIEVRIFQCKIDFDYLMEKITLVQRLLKYSKTNEPIHEFKI